MATIRKGFGAEIDEKVCAAFDAQMLERKGKKWEKVETSLKIWLSLPETLQAKLLTANQDNIYNVLVNGLVDAEIEAHLEALGPIKNELLRLLREAKVKASRKK